MRAWARRVAKVRGELAEIADVRAPHWWLVAGGAAFDWRSQETYIANNAEPSSDTFIGHVVDVPSDPFVTAVVRARAARQALIELNGALAEQPLAMTVLRDSGAATLVPSTLSTVAFAIGSVCWHAQIPKDDAGVLALAAELATASAGGTPQSIVAVRSGQPSTRQAPFVCVSIGDEPLETARHGHRRAWTATGGPWLGLARTDRLAIVSTCHFVVDGFGHARLAARIAELARTFEQRIEAVTKRDSAAAGREGVKQLDGATKRNGASRAVPALAVVDGSAPLEITWRPIAPGLRALPLAYALGQVLFRLAGDPRARFSPTFQIPIAPGSPDEPERIRRRVIPTIASVLFADGVPEPFDQFAVRTKQALAREASGTGMTTRFIAAVRGIPAPLALKRHLVAADRPGWLDPVATVIAGRGCVSRIELDVPSPPACAVSSPARTATSSDSLGGGVLTVVDDGARAAITLCGSGRAACSELLDEILASAQS